MSATLTPGMLLADTYRVVRLVGAGGMGEVYEATHDRLSGRYAIKVLLGGSSNRAEVFQRFKREAEVTSGLRHPNIVQVVDFNVTPQGHPYLVMEYLDGVELADEIDRVGPMPLARVLDIVGQIASALAAAHRQNIVHRDLKPQNLFLVRLPGENREVVKVVDFGISKVREATTVLTQESAVLGTPQYMSPEQAEGRLSQIDERTDEFSLAVITYELLTGRPAFHADTVPALIYQVVLQQPEPIRNLSPTIGPAVEAVVSKAMSKAQDQRYPTVLAFSGELAAAAESDQGIASVGRPATTPPPREEPPLGATTTTLRAAAASMEVKTGQNHASRRWLLGAGIAAAGVVVLLALWSREGSQASQPANSTVDPVAGVKQAPEPSAVPKLATVEVEDAPLGLQASVDGVAAVLPVRLPAGPELHTLYFTAPGFEAIEIRIDGMREHRSIVLNMKPVESAEKGRSLAKKQPGRPAARWTSPAKETDRAGATRSGKSSAPSGMRTDKRTGPW
jgi:eukaryotic-like serine/threonine-protein kinase